MAETTSGRRRFSDKWGKHELDVLAVLSSAFPQWLTSRQIAQRVKAYADSYGELADQAAKAAFAKQFQRDRAKLAAMGIAIESRQPEYSSKSEGQDFASYRLQLGSESRIRIKFEPEDLPVLAAANYLARSMSLSSQSQQLRRESRTKVSRTTPRVPQVPVPGLGLDSIAPGLGTQSIPDILVKEIESRRFTATVDVDGEDVNVAYTDSDDLATYVLEHPGAYVRNPVEAADSYHRRLEAATMLESADFSSKTDPVPIAEYIAPPLEDFDDDTSSLTERRSVVASFQTGSEVDRRLRLMLFLSAHLGEEFSIEMLAEKFVGKAQDEEDLKRSIAVIHKDIGTLTTVSDDGELAGSQFFDVDWSLLEAEGIICATNSLGLERLAGIAPQYLSMLMASVSYLAHSPVMSEDWRKRAARLMRRMRAHNIPKDTLWLSLTGYELEPSCYEIVKDTIDRGYLLDMDYSDASGKIRRALVAPAEIYVDEGVYYVAVWNGVTDKDRMNPPEEGLQTAQQALTAAQRKNHRDWQTLRLSRIEKARPVQPSYEIDMPNVPLSELRQWNADNATKVVFVTNTAGLPFIHSLQDATVEPWGKGEKVCLTVQSDSWFVAFCIAHARHISAVAPETLRTMIIARAERELSLEEKNKKEREND